MQSRYRSFFWPAVLILAGVVALLVNIGAISGDRLYLLFDLWPLIVIGLEIILRRTWQGAQADLAGALIVVLAIAGSIGYLALSPNPAVHRQDVSFEITSGLEKASLEIDAAAATVNISGGGDLGNKLFAAHYTYTGQGPTTADSNGEVTIAQN